MSDQATDTVQPEQGQGQQPSTADVQGGSPQGGTGPWAADLASLGLDEQSLAAVDEYMRSKVQPRITQLEQKSSVAENAQRFYEDFNSDPLNTYIAVTEEVFGADYAQQVAQNLEQLLAEGDTGDESQTPTEGEPVQTGNLDPRVARVVEHFETEQARSQYQSAKQEVLGKDENKDIDPDLFDPFVAAAEGDWDLAVQGYRAFYDRFSSKFAPSDGSQPEPQAPPAMGGNAQGTTTPPVQTKYNSTSEAIDAMFDDARGGPAPPVGTV